MLPTVKDAELAGKRVLLRADLNVPLSPDGRVRDKQRIVDILPTINYILHSGAKQLIMLSHHGRPGGKYDSKESLRGVWHYFREMAYDLHFVDSLHTQLPEKKLMLLENVRFHPEEEQNDPNFARDLAALGDIFVNDAFASNRAHASTAGIIDHLPSYIGFLYEREITALSLTNVEGPIVFLLGGAKASTKLPMIRAIAERADSILLGGLLPFYWFKALGYEIGATKFEPEYLQHGREMLSHKNIHLPKDLVVAKEIAESAAARVLSPENLEKDDIGLDIGPETVALYKSILEGAGTIIWNGPMGFYEVEQFAHNTDALIAHLTKVKGRVIAGGGDSITVLNKLKLREHLDYVSTGGGAALNYLRDGTLPVIELMKRQMAVKYA